MANWPEQPVNVIIKWLKKQSPSWVVADFGCGDAHLAKNVKNKVFSLDLATNDPNVIACDLSNTPLGSSSIDVAPPDFSNKMFIVFYFKKKDKPSTRKKEIEWPVLKPCLYKRR